MTIPKTQITGVLLAATLLGLAACGSDATPPASGTVAPDATTSATAAPATQEPAASVPGVGLKATEDPALLGILPETVDGVAVEQESQAFADATADGDFNKHIERAVFGIAVKGSDLVAAVVAKPYSGTYSDAFFKDWRETYDDGACAQAGGVAGSSEADLGTRKVYPTACNGGLQTYHVWLPMRAVIVSAFSVGDKDYGERLLVGLRP